MEDFSKNFTDNYNAIVAATKGASPQTHVLAAATLLTIFQSVWSLAVLHIAEYSRRP